MIRNHLANLKIIHLEELHIEKSTFSCTSQPLEDYFHRYVSQDVKKGLAKCFVLIDNEKSAIIGYYTLSALSIPISDIPQNRIKKGIPYPNLPAVLLGRLAIDRAFQHQGYGKFLVVDAIHKIRNSHIGAVVLIVDAKDENAVLFYEKLGFIAFQDLNGNSQKLFYPLTTAIK